MRNMTITSKSLKIWNLSFLLTARMVMFSGVCHSVHGRGVCIHALGGVCLGGCLPGGMAFWFDLLAWPSGMAFWYDLL